MSRVTPAPKSADRRARREDDRSELGRLTISNVRKVFRRKGSAPDTRAIDDVSLTIEPGTFVVLLGPSGCGKTTLLRCLAGLEAPDSGAIRINGRDVYDSERRVDLPTSRRRVSMMFQSYALWPHMTVEANVMYPILSRKAMGRAEARIQAGRVLEIVGLGHLAKEHPGSLSGGQQQRVALARAISADPSVVLFDEPLSNVDAQVREQLRLELSSMQRRLGFTAIYVTHDQAEALALADVLILMGDGKVAQAGPPPELYARPASRYVAEFIGRANLIDGEVLAVDGADVRVVTEGGEITLPADQCPEGTATAPGSWVSIVSRPEDIVLAGSDHPNRVTLTVANVIYLGSHVDVVGTIGSSPRVFRANLPKGAQPPALGDRIEISLPPDHLWMVAR
jgi:iron(III) transport system ATP-binding protein